MHRVVITGVGSYLPKKILSNDDLSKIVNTSNEWILSRTGISKRHVASEGELTSDLATQALINALNNANISVNDLDGIILATTTPDLIFPSTAIHVHKNVGMNNGFAFDVQAVCSGFVYALSIAHGMIMAGTAKNIAVIGAETLSRIINWQDRTTCVLFGDGAGAVILSSLQNTYRGILDIILYSNSTLIDILKVNGGVSKGNLEAKISMNGKEVFRHAVSEIANIVNVLLKRNKISINELDWILPHQANTRIIDAVAERVKISPKKVITSLAVHSNTSAASIPLALDHYIKSKKVFQGQLVLMVSVGAGFTFGGALLRL